ncbi:hypothetical protein HYU40_00925 [Candidatus Woesearchaeota archaeon]|nr:hypothetical protein [Candidatus Woesearchaeota archaeon]
MATNKLFSSNSLLLAAALATVLLAAGCGQLGGGKGKASTIPEVYTGTAGVEATFAPDGVPSVMTEGSTSDAVLLISNRGAVDADISDAIVKVSDNAEAVVFGDDKKKVKVIGSDELVGMLSDTTVKASKKLPGKVSNTVGSLDSIKVKVTAKNVPGNDAVTTGLLSTVCYKYETRLTANVCVDAAPFSFQKQRKPCDAKLPLVFQSQGAPVAVKKIETLSPEKEGGFVRPKFKIYFANAASGTVIDKNSLNLFCTDKDPSKTDDKVRIIWVDSVALNDKELVCNNKDEKRNARPITLTGSLANDFVLCSYTENDFREGSGVFATPLKVEVSYGYRSTSEPVPVRVEKGFAPASP